MVQFRASTDKADNLGRIASYIAEAAGRGASLCAFPEFMMLYTPPSQGPAELAALAEPVGGPFVRAVAAEARRHSIGVVGTLYERAPSAAAPRRARVYDTSFLLSPAGRLVSAYRKVHLYDALGFRESDKLAPGSRVPRPHGSGAGRLGMMICYDLRFPEMARGLAAAGADVLVAPSAWVRGEMKEEHWMVVNRARAVENGCFVVSPDQTGSVYCGRSVVVDPFGRVLLDMGRRQGLAVADLDLSLVASVRRSMPLLRSRRTDLYADLGRPAGRGEARGAARPGRRGPAGTRT